MKKEINEILGARVKESRKLKKITREQLAEKINVSVRFLADVEVGAVGVSLSTLRELCFVLEVSADYLIGATEHLHNDEFDVAIQRLKRIPTAHLPQIEELLKVIEKLVL